MGGLTMATIGLDKMYYATITEDADGNETYALPKILGKAINAELSVEIADQTLYADDGAAYVIKEFQSGTITLNTADLKSTVVAELTGAVIDTNGVLISSSEDGGVSVAVGFRAKRPEGNYRYFWVYKVKFASPSVSLNTKGESIEFQTPTIEGTIMRRNRPDSTGKHPWKSEVVEGDANVLPATIAAWYTAVYEPTH